MVGHIHIADASGIDGEGLAFGGGDAENTAVWGALDLIVEGLKFGRSPRSGSGIPNGTCATVEYGS